MKTFILYVGALCFAGMNTSCQEKNSAGRLSLADCAKVAYAKGNLGVIKDCEVVHNPQLTEVKANIEAHPENWFWLMKAGIFYSQQDALDKAEAFLSKSVNEVKDANPYPYFYMGAVKEAKNQPKEAYDMYRKAVDLDAASKDKNPVFAEALKRVSPAANPAK